MKNDCETPILSDNYEMANLLNLASFISEFKKNAYNY